MHSDLERLIRLQQLDTFIDTARRRADEHPALVAALDSRLTAAQDAVAGAKHDLEEGLSARRMVEKDLALIQSRLSKYKDQLMEVKTNREYQAMLKEIEVAQSEIRRLEDRLLEHMVAADDLSARVKSAEARLAEDRQSVAEERKRLEEETASMQVEVERSLGRRDELVRALPPALLNTYETLMKGRRGVALAEARAELCTACHVRLRPQVFNELRRNDSIIQCGSCQRILYFAAPPPTSAGDAAEGFNQ